MELLKRKIDRYLASWKQNPSRKPLIVKGARQIGKTNSIRAFGRANYESVIEINFVLQKKFCSIFDNGYEVDTIIKNISLMEPSWRFIPHKTLIFFDELQKCPDCATSLKSFNEDRRYDVICSGSLMGIYYEEIESNAVGNKEDYEMHSMDFEEFLWAKGYSESQVEDLYAHMVSLTPFSELELSTYMDIFRDYMTIGGMPEVVKMYIDKGHFGGSLELLRQLLLDYEEDISKYAKESDKAKILAIYKHISTFLAKTSKKYQISKVAKGARSREYIGAVEWLEKAGVVNVCYCLMLIPTNYITTIRVCLLLLWMRRLRRTLGLAGTSEHTKVPYTKTLLVKCFVNQAMSNCTTIRTIAQPLKWISLYVTQTPLFL